MTVTKQLNDKQEKQVKLLIHEAINSALGDMAEYLNYLNDRLEAVEEKSGIEAPAQFAGEIAARYGFPDGKKEVEETIPSVSLEEQTRTAQRILELIKAHNTVQAYNESRFDLP